MDKIGIGIITYNRSQQFKKLLDSIKNINYIDHIVIIKNKDIDYGINNPINFVSQKISYYNLITEKCVASCKNKAMQQLINLDCTHIFLIEDDIQILNEDVFKEYINTARTFNIQHLNFCGNSNYCEYIIQCKQKTLQFVKYLYGGFQYFTKQGIYQVGYMDDQNFINLLQHVQHTYRFHLLGLSAPKFHLFPDIANSNKYLRQSQSSKQTTIIQSEQYLNNLYHGFQYFKEKYGIQLNRLQAPTFQQLCQFYSLKKGIIKQSS